MPGPRSRLVAHLVTIAKLGANGAFSTENTKPIHDIVKRNTRTGSESFYLNMDIAPDEMRA